MLKITALVLSIVAFGYAATLVPCADSKCRFPFVNDTLLDSASAMEHRFRFQKDAGEQLGVAAVRLQINGKVGVPWLQFEQIFYWARSDGAERRGSSNSSLFGDSANIDGYRFVQGSGASLINSMMAISRQDVDTLLLVERVAFYRRTDSMVKLGFPAQGDTLHWNLSLIYFHASEMDFFWWTNGWGGAVLENGDTISWVGSDTVTVRYRTIMRDYSPPDVGVKQGYPRREQDAMGRYDLQGRPVSGGGHPAGVVLERTKQGFRKRLQLR